MEAELSSETSEYLATTQCGNQKCEHDSVNKNRDSLRTNTVTPGLKVDASKNLAREVSQQHSHTVNISFAICSSDVPSVGHRLSAELRASPPVTRAHDFITRDGKGKIVPLHTTKFILKRAVDGSE
jgi:hypothetical protein